MYCLFPHRQPYHQKYNWPKYVTQRDVCTEKVYSGKYAVMVDKGWTKLLSLWHLQNLNKSMYWCTSSRRNVTIIYPEIKADLAFIVSTVIMLTLKNFCRPTLVFNFRHDQSFVLYKSAILVLDGVFKLTVNNNYINFVLTVNKRLFLRNKD